MRVRYHQAGPFPDWGREADSPAAAATGWKTEKVERSVALGLG